MLQTITDVEYLGTTRCFVRSARVNDARLTSHPSECECSRMPTTSTSAHSESTSATMAIYYIIRYGRPELCFSPQFAAWE